MTDARTTVMARLSTTLEFPTSHAGGLVARLNQEWPSLYPDLERVLDRWIIEAPVLASYRLEPHTAVDLAYDEADAYLLALLDRAKHAPSGSAGSADPDERTDERTDAGWAARILLQLMLPAILRLTRMMRGEHDDEPEAEAQAVAAMHEAIVRYPTERRQRCAANLLFDAMRLARRDSVHGALVRGAQVQLAPAPPEHTRLVGQAPSATSASEELLWLLARAVARGDLTREQARLLADGTAYGWSRRLARELGISVAAVRQRRRYAVGKLRASAADLDPDSDWFERRLDTARRSTRRAPGRKPTGEPTVGQDQSTPPPVNRQPLCWPDAS